MRSDKFTKCEINWFKLVLDNWCRLNEEILEKFCSIKYREKRIPWKNNERSLVSILAGAVWKSGYVAIEEFSDNKGRKKDVSEYAGRCDLEVLLPKNERFRFEAKKHRLTVGKREGFIEDKVDKIKGTLRRAGQDAGKLKTQPEIKRFGVVFIIPRFSAEYKKEEIEERLRKLKDLARKLFSNCGCNSMAWFFVDSYEYDQVKIKEYIYPGIIIVLKERKKL